MPCCRMATVADLIPGLGEPEDFDVITEPDASLLSQDVEAERGRRQAPTFEQPPAQHHMTVFGTGCCEIPDTSIGCRGLGICVAAAATPINEGESGPGRDYTIISLFLLFAGSSLSLLFLYFRLVAMSSGDTPIVGWGGVVWPFVVVTGVCFVVFSVGTCLSCYTATDNGDHGAGAFGTEAYGSDADVAQTRRSTALKNAGMNAASAAGCIILFVSSINAAVALDAADAGDTEDAAAKGMVAVGGITIISVAAFVTFLIGTFIRIARVRADLIDTGAFPAWGRLGRQ